MKQGLLFFIAYLILFITGNAQVKTDAEEAFRISSETGKPVLLVFAGSDWCAPCIRFEKKILNENTFLDFAKTNIVVLKANFPQREKLPKSIQAQNEKLAERYNPKGIFPAFVLLRSDQSVLSTLQYDNQTPLEFIEEIKRILIQ